MTINETTRHFIDLLDDFTQHALKEKDRLATLMQIAGDARRESVIGELAFHGKYLWRLYQTTQREPRDSDRFPKLEEEFSRTVQEFQTIVATLIRVAPDEERDMLERHFLAVNAAALQHALHLAHDFHWMKNWELEYEENEMPSEE